MIVCPITAFVALVLIFGAGIMLRKPPPRHRYNLPDHVAKALLPIFKRLSDKKRLERCMRARTQHSNESLHSLIRALAPKERHASLFSIEAAVAEAAMNFIAGHERSSAEILHELNMNPGQRSTKRMRVKDQQLSVSSACKRASADNVQQTLKKYYVANVFIFLNFLVLRGDVGRKTAIFISKICFMFLAVSARLISPLSHKNQSEPEMIGKLLTRLKHSKWQDKAQM